MVCGYVQQSHLYARMWQIGKEVGTFGDLVECVPKLPGSRGNPCPTGARGLRVIAGGGLADAVAGAGRPVSRIWRLEFLKYTS
ncbi:hypothetical protein Mro03_55640 [Microbispora rosea subsp. rosea]|nr:hypothetical protein Mro03_55640 [Microbispora rosea subsp. rosea]